MRVTFGEGSDLVKDKQELAEVLQMTTSLQPSGKPIHNDFKYILKCPKNYQRTQIISLRC